MTVTPFYQVLVMGAYRMRASSLLVIRWPSLIRGYEFSERRHRLDHVEATVVVPGSFKLNVPFGQGRHCDLFFE